MGEHLLPIGRFSELCRLTVKALRHYDELGLLRPARVDPQSGYRYYALSQARQARLIALLRSVDMPLADISEALRATNPGDARAVLDRHRQRLEERLAAGQAMLATVAGLLMEEDGMQYQVQTRELPGVPIYAVRVQTTFPELSQQIGPAIDEIFIAIGLTRAGQAGPPIVRYYAMSDAHIDMEAGVPVEREIAPPGRVTLGRLDGGLHAYTTHVGPYATVGNAWDAVEGWVREHGHEHSGPAFEMYYTSPETDPPDRQRTEVFIPIR